MLDVEMIRRDFPILSRQVNGKPLVYLDNGASAQKPQVVINVCAVHVPLILQIPVRSDFWEGFSI